MTIEYNTFKVIDKPRYSKHLKISFFSACAYLLVVAVTCSTLLIYFLGNENGDNFWLNIFGVIIALASCFTIYSSVKTHAFFEDIVYIREIKAQLNYIYRKQKKIQAAAEQGDATAMSILYFSYSASRYVFELDDNTLTLEELEKSEQQLQELAAKYTIERYNDYDPALLKDY